MFLQVRWVEILLHQLVVHFLFFVQQFLSFVINRHLRAFRLFGAFILVELNVKRAILLDLFTNIELIKRIVEIFFLFLYDGILLKFKLYSVLLLNYRGALAPVHL